MLTRTGPPRAAGLVFFMQLVKKVSRLNVRFLVWPTCEDAAAYLEVSHGLIIQVKCCAVAAG